MTFHKFRVLLATVCTSLAVVTTQPIAHAGANYPVLPTWAKSATIYEVNMRQYTTEGTFNAFSNSLPRLKALGVKILWLMPVQPISVLNRKGTLGSEYSIADYKGINPEFGNAADFTALITKAHQLGFKVILDWVADHSGWDNPWMANKAWYHQDANGNVISPNPDWSDVAWLNYDNADMRAAMIDAMSYWVKTFDIDGFRADVASGVPVDFWNQANNVLQAIKPLFMLAEDQGHNDLLSQTFVANYNWDLLNVINGIGKGSKGVVDLIQVAVGQSMTYPKGAFPMNFITNHDENTWNGSEYARLGNGVKALSALYFTYPGIPLIYSGQEVGNTKQIAFFEKDLIPGLTSANATSSFYAKLIDLKNRNNALWNDSPAPFNPIDNSNNQIVAFSRTRGVDTVVTLINISNTKQKTTLRLGKLAGKYHLLQAGKLSALPSNVTLNPWQFEIYSTK
jgi:glycosidase